MKAFLSTLLVLLWVAAAHAQPSDQQKAEAKLHYQKAEAAMIDGRYAEAAQEYAVAYEVIGDALLFYKIGNAYQLAGDCTAAVIYFKRYLKEGKPQADFQATVEGRITDCEGGGAGTTTGPTVETDLGTGTDTPTETGSGTTTTTGTGAGTTTATETGTDAGMGDGTAAPSFLGTQPSWKKTAAWVSLASAIGFGTVGSILMMSSRSREQDLDALAAFRDPSTDLPAEYQGTVQERYETYVEEGERFRRWSTMAFAVAGVSAAASVVFFVLEGGSGGGAESGSVITRITPVVAPDQAGFAATFGF